MKSTNEICIANQEGKPLTEQELRYALEALRTISHFEHESLIDLIEAIREGKPTVKLRAEFAWGTIERMFTAGKRPVDEWLGPDNIPGSPVYLKRLEAAKRLFTKATGVNLCI